MQLIGGLASLSSSHLSKFILIVKWVRCRIFIHPVPKILTPIFSMCLPAKPAPILMSALNSIIRRNWIERISLRSGSPLLLLKQSVRHRWNLMTPLGLENMITRLLYSGSQSHHFLCKLWTLLLPSMVIRMASPRGFLLLILLILTLSLGWLKCNDLPAVRQFFSKAKASLKSGAKPVELLFTCMKSKSAENAPKYISTASLSLGLPWTVNSQGISPILHPNMENL